MLGIQDKISSYQAKRIAIIELNKFNVTQMPAYKQISNLSCSYYNNRKMLDCSKIDSRNFNSMNEC